jgi:putative glutamine amidotransferase
MMIGLTDQADSGKKYQQYITWLQTSHPEVSVVRLSCDSGNLSDIDRCDGLVLTGGGDVSPELYGGQTDHRALTGVDRQRDDFELSLLRLAYSRAMPVLGICRGMQIANVFFGGTLFEHLGDYGFSSHEEAGTKELWHDIINTPDSLLSTVTKNLRCSVNSYHHQAVNRIGSGLSVSAKTDDGVVEALERNNLAQAPFLLLVQWHPERMHDVQNPMCSDIREKFLSAITTIY